MNEQQQSNMMQQPNEQPSGLFGLSDRNQLIQQGADRFGIRMPFDKGNVSGRPENAGITDNTVNTAQPVSSTGKKSSYLDVSGKWNKGMDSTDPQERLQAKGAMQLKRSLGAGNDPMNLDEYGNDISSYPEDIRRKILMNGSGSLDAKDLQRLQGSGSASEFGFTPDQNKGGSCFKG